MAKRPSKPRRKVKAAKKKTAVKKKASPKKKAVRSAAVSPARPPPPPADAFNDPTEELSDRDIVGVIEEHGVLDQLSEHNH